MYLILYEDTGTVFRLYVYSYETIMFKWKVTDSNSQSNRRKFQSFYEPPLQSGTPSQCHLRCVRHMSQQSIICQYGLCLLLLHHLLSVILFVSGTTGTDPSMCC